MTVHRRRSVSRTVLTVVVPATAVAALGVASSFASAAPVVVGPVVGGPVVAAATGPGAVAREFPAPVVPAIVPEAPLSSYVVEPVVYTCEPWADPRFDDRANPHLITNKDCPELNAVKEQAQREYVEQLQAEDVVGGDGLEVACSDPSSAQYGTAACGSDLDGDGALDGVTG